MSYNTLQRWLDEHSGEYRVMMYDSEEASYLKQMLPPGSLISLERNHARRTFLPEGVRRHLASIAKHYDTVLVLCVNDEQVTTGQAPYRILGEMLFPHSLVLIGPHTAKAWPGWRGLFYPSRAREIIVLMTAGTLSLITTIATLSAIALYEMVTQRRRTP